MALGSTGATWAVQTVGSEGSAVAVEPLPTRRTSGAASPGRRSDSSTTA